MLIDVTMPIRTGVVVRPGTPPVDIATRRFEHGPGDTFETAVFSFPAHTATHVDLVFKERSMALDRMISPGKLVDVTRVGARKIQREDIESQAGIEAGDFVVIKTRWSAFGETEKYHDHPELALETVEWLASLKVNAVGIDAPGIGRGRHHGPYDALLAEHDILVVENLTNLCAIPNRDFTVLCLPLSVQDVDAVPARVLIQLQDI